MLSVRHCTLRRLHVPIRQLCELYRYDQQLFLLQFQRPVSELDCVVELLEQHSNLGLVELFSLFDAQDRFIAHFRIDRFPPNTGLLGFHGGSFVPSPSLGRVFLEGSLLLLEATRVTHEWTRVLTNCLATNQATSHFLTGLGFQRGYIARSQRLISGHPVDVMHLFLTRSVYLASRLRQRLIGDKTVAALPAGPAKRTVHSGTHCIASQDSVYRSVMESCRGVISEFSSAGTGSRLRLIDESHVERFLSPAIAEILAEWKRYTGMDECPGGLDDIVAAWGSYTQVMLLLPLCVLDDAGVHPAAFFVIRLFSGNPNLAEIAGNGLHGVDPATFAAELRMLLNRLLSCTGLCRIQARAHGGKSPWHPYLGFAFEGHDHEGNAVYSLVSGDVDGPC